MANTGSILQQMRTLYGETLRLSPHNIGIVDYMLAVTVAAQFPGDVEPVWGFIVGPSGCGKSECLQALRGLVPRYVEKCDAFTDKSFVSGLVDDSGEDYSYLLQLQNKLLWIDDFCNVSTMKKDECSSLQSLWRQAYSGEASKAFGTGKKSIACHFNILANTVPSIDRFLIAFQQLGQRFLMFRFSVPSGDRRRLLAHARRMHSTRQIWRATLRSKAAALLVPFLEALPSDQNLLLSPLSKEHNMQVVCLSELVALARTLPETLNFSQSKHPLENPPDPELGTRLGNQLDTLGWARVHLDGRTKWTSDDIEFVSRIAWDSIPVIGQRLLLTLRTGCMLSADQISSRLNYPANKIRAILAQYEEFQLVAGHPSPSRVMKWALTADTLKTISELWGHRSWWPSISMTPRMEQH